MTNNVVELKYNAPDLNRTKLDFGSEDLNFLVESGRMIAQRQQDFLAERMGLKDMLVEAFRHTILSGPAGVGKTHGTMELLKTNNCKHLMVASGESELSLIIRVAVAVASLKSGEELILVADDADDVVFGDYKSLSKWKQALQDATEFVTPMIEHQVNMTNTLLQLRKAGKDAVADAVESFQNPDSIGVSIPMDRVRLLVLCNLDLEDPKAFKGKMKTAVGPVVERTNYKRMNLTVDQQWGWLAYTLSNSQPFEEAVLDDDQKVKLLLWLKDNWDDIRREHKSYRFVRKLAEAIINHPTKHRDIWNSELKGN